MPELPEVENFRRLLLPLVSGELLLERCSLEKTPPRKFITDEEIHQINESKYVVADVVRKGKLICMLLEPNGAKESNNNNNNNKNNNKTSSTKRMFLHMGMTGRISNPTCIPKLKELSDTETYPPPCTYLRLIAGPNQACYSDPRKFGAVYLRDALGDDDFGVLAPDAWTDTRGILIKNKTPGESAENRRAGEAIADNDAATVRGIVAKLTQQSMGIKGVLLDQKRALCGVGNWVADEVLYQTQTHPDQNYLTEDESEALLYRLHVILDDAVRCLYDGKDFPQEWLFHYRWSKRGSKTTAVKDAHGRSIVFVTSGGRTSAVVPSVQKKLLRKRAPFTTIKEEPKKAKTPNNNKKRTAATATSTTIATPSAVISGKSEKKVRLLVAKELTKSTAPSKDSLKESRTKKDTAQAGVVTKRGTRRSPRLAKL